MEWRLAIDLGTNSIGWWAYEVEPPDNQERSSWNVVRSLDGGVRIFSDGREPAKAGRVGDSLSVNRRMARGMRRNRDRRRNRVAALVQDLVKLRLLPADEEERKKLFDRPRSPGNDTSSKDRYNPCRLRSEAVKGPVRTLCGLLQAPLRSCKCCRLTGPTGAGV